MKKTDTNNQEHVLETNSGPVSMSFNEIRLKGIDEMMKMVEDHGQIFIIVKGHLPLKLCRAELS